jgi:hypothetical protein
VRRNQAWRDREAYTGNRSFGLIFSQLTIGVLYALENGPCDGVREASHQEAFQRNRTSQGIQRLIVLRRCNPRCVAISEERRNIVKIEKLLPAE